MASRAILVGGVGAALTAEDVTAIALGGEVCVDAAALDRIKKDSPAPKSFVPVEHGGTDGDSSHATLDITDSRAALAVRLLTLITGKTKIRSSVVTYLTDLLNDGLAPGVLQSSSDELASASFVDACHGLGSVAAPGEGSSDTTAQTSAAGQPLEAALVSKGLQPPGLSAQEQHVLSSGQSASTGMACVAVTAGKTLLAAANAVAALSSEALQADTKQLELEAELHVDKSVADVTSQLLGLMDGSRQINPKKGATRSEAISAVPLFHGAAMDALDSARTALRAQLALPTTVNDKGEVSCSMSPAVSSALMRVSQALLPLISMSLRRTSAATGALEAAAAAAGAGVGGGAAAAFKVPPESSELASAAQALLPSLKVQAVEVDAVLFDARKRTVEVGSKMVMAEDGQIPSVAAALVANECAAALRRALTIEATCTLLLLRLQQGPHTGGAVPSGQEAAAAEGGAGKGGGKGGKKKGGGGGPSFALGKGSQLLRNYLEAGAKPQQRGQEDGTGADGAASSEAEGSMSMRMLDSSPGDTPYGDHLDLDAALRCTSQLLDPLGSRLAPVLATLRQCIEANQGRRRPKIPKGTRDLLPDQMTIRQAAFNTVEGVFRRHGAVAIDTPVFELRETLMGKYGEDSKLIYDLADQGGEILSLRYDLTVPFARYVALHGIGTIKRYHIGKVYRRDQPQLARGRFREFYQCDFDIAGAYPTMVPDAECLKVLVEILSGLPLGEFTVKVNHRKLLDAMLEIAGVPQQKFRPICSAIDKLDKEPWQAVRREMVEDKGLAEGVADKIGQFVVLAGRPLELLATLQAEDHPLNQHPGSKAALDEMGLLFGYLDTMGALGPLRFDLSLARGLDYYTGVIYEAVLQGGNVGSIAAGGRYDGLVGMFSGKDIPAVGVSIGIERVFSIMEERMRQQAAECSGMIRETQTQVLVASIGNGLQQQRMRICSQLWEAGIKAEFGYKSNPKMGDQLGYALKSGVPLMVLFGEDEIKSGKVKVKNLQRETEELIEASGLVVAVHAALQQVDDGPVVSSKAPPAAGAGSKA